MIPKREHPKDEKNFMILLCLLIFFNFLFTGGRANILIQLLYTYVNEYLLWTVEEGTLLVTMYQVTGVVAVIAVAFLSRWIKPFHIMVADNMFLLSGSFIMVILVGESKSVIWVGICLCAIGISNINPTTITLVNKYATPSGRITGLMLSAAALGKITISTLVGIWMDRSWKIYPAALTGLSLVTSLLLVVWYFMTPIHNYISSKGYREIACVEEDKQEKISHVP